MQISLDLGNTTLVVGKVDDILKPEAALINILLGSATGLRVPIASAAGVNFLRGVGARGGLMEQMRVRVFNVLPPADLFINSTIDILRFRQALRQAVTVSGTMGRRLGRSRRVSRRTSGIASGQALQSHVPLVAGAHADALSACIGQVGHKRAVIVFNWVDHILLAEAALITWLFERTARAVQGNRPP